MLPGSLKLIAFAPTIAIIPNPNPPCYRPMRAFIPYQSMLNKHEWDINPLTLFLRSRQFELFDVFLLLLRLSALQPGHGESAICLSTTQLQSTIIMERNPSGWIPHRSGTRILNVTSLLELSLYLEQFAILSSKQIIHYHIICCQSELESSSETQPATNLGTVFHTMNWSWKMTTFCAQCCWSVLSPFPLSRSLFRFWRQKIVFVAIWWYSPKTRWSVNWREKVNPFSDHVQWMASSQIWVCMFVHYEWVLDTKLWKLHYPASKSPFFPQPTSWSYFQSPIFVPGEANGSNRNDGSLCRCLGFTPGSDFLAGSPSFPTESTLHHVQMGLAQDQYWLGNQHQQGPILGKADSSH